MKRIAIDFDGVLHDGKGIPRSSDIKGKPKENAVDAIKFLEGLGYECYVFTARDESEFDDIYKWLLNNKFPAMDVTNKKISAIAYIDDRAIRFTNWQDICKLYG